MNFQPNNIHVLTRYEEDNSLMLVLGCFSDTSLSSTSSFNEVLFTKRSRHLLQIAVEKGDIEFDYVANSRTARKCVSPESLVQRHREDFGGPGQIIVKSLWGPSLPPIFGQASPGAPSI